MEIGFTSFAEMRCMCIMNIYCGLNGSTGTVKEFGFTFQFRVTLFL